MVKVVGPKGDFVHYSCTAEEAVMAAHAQAHGDFNTWDYHERYGSLLTHGNRTVACGDYIAVRDDLEEGKRR